MRDPVTTGIEELDALIGNLYVGDNVIWYDNAGSLADVFYLNLIRSSLHQNSPLIYVSFDRSLKNLIEKLGSLAQSKTLTIIDCFTYGKGNGAGIFVDYQRQAADAWPGTLITVPEPHRMEDVAEAFYAHHRSLKGTVRFIFESLTGMQDLWGGEDQLVSFYVRTCPRLYDLNTIAYWLIEKQAHSARLRAQINQIAQVVVDLSVRRGKTALEIIKAENRMPDRRKKPFPYFSKDSAVHFDPDTHAAGKMDLGRRIKFMRSRIGLSQTDLAKRVGVTPSSISQIEGGLIYPSLPALFRMADVFGIDMGSLFKEDRDSGAPVVFKPSDLQPVVLPEMAGTDARGWRLPGIASGGRLAPLLIDIPPGTKLPSHFCRDKGREIGYLLHGKLVMTYQAKEHALETGDFVHIGEGWPTAWENPGETAARLLWLVSGPA